MKIPKYLKNIANVKISLKMSGNSKNDVWPNLGIQKSLNKSEKILRKLKNVEKFEKKLKKITLKRGKSLKMTKNSEK